ncbi:MAG: single-stranded DNA-binding protein [Armatimonadetes bacterium]|nr:single-stranded DNA-binding protein [Armatimonadota bacterium]
MSTEAKGVIELPAESFSRREERAALATVPPADATPMSMLAVAVQRGMDPATIKDLLALQKEWEANEARKAFNEAFAAFKAEAVKVIKNRTVDAGPLLGKSYAELFSVVDAVTPALSKHGLSAAWRLTKDEKDWIEVTCCLKHRLGHSECVAMGGPPDTGGAKSAIQARASTVSYLERYTLKAVCGVAEQGDDTNGGGGKGATVPDPAGKQALEACGSLSALQDAWKALTPEQRKTLAEVKERCKANIKAAEAEASQP